MACGRLRLGAKDRLSLEEVFTFGWFQGSSAMDWLVLFLFALAVGELGVFWGAKPVLGQLGYRRRIKNLWDQITKQKTNSFHKQWNFTLIQKLQQIQKLDY